MKLQWKILLPIVGLLIILLGASNYLSYSQSAQALEEALTDNMQGESAAILRATETMVKDSIADTERVVHDEKTFDFFERRIPADQMSFHLKQVAEEYIDLDFVVMLDLSGVAVVASDSTLLAKSFADQPFFQKALAGTNAISPVVQSHNNPAVLQMLLAVPVKVNNKVIGVVLTAMNMERYFETVLAPIRIGETGYAYAADAEGRMVAHRDKNVLFKTNFATNKMLKAVYDSDEDSGSAEIVNADNKPRQVFYAQNRDLSLLIIVAADPNEVFSGLDEIRTTSMSIAIATVVLAALVVYLVTLPIVRALRQSVAFADEVAHGHLHAQLSVKRSDEIGTLADSLRDIPEVLLRVMDEYRDLANAVEHGDIEATGDASTFSGEYADLITGTNTVLDMYKTIVNSIPTPVVILDKDQKASYLNRTAQGYTGPDYKGKTCGMLFDREDHGTSACAFAKAIAQGSPASGETLARPQGKAVDISYTVIPLYDREKKLASILQLLTDLTAIKSTQRTIMEVADQAHEISNRVATAATELSSQVEEVNAGTDVQRDRAASTATAMEEMNSTVLEVARNAAQASEQAEGTRKKATEGAALVTQVVAAIEHVNKVAVELEKNIQELGSQAESIGEVMNVISDIADQTNLLALNAAIEAARAGDAGRGFAVVADEVRKLAENTMRATNEVGGRIKAIQDATSTNIERVADAATGVAKATELAATSGIALSEILDFANANSSLITGIATAAEQQSATSEEINLSIDEINRIAGETADGMSESASAVNELSQMAQELRTLLERLHS